MSSIICLIAGILLGAIITYITYHDTLKSKNTLIEDYKKGINIHNYREVRLVFINQSTKDYVKQQLNILKEHEADLKTDDDKIMAAARYIAFKDIEKNINQLEKNSEDLVKK